MMPTNKTDRQFFSGNTLEQAVLAAARHFNLEPERVAYKPRDKKHGFLNIRRRVVIEVDPSDPERPEEEVSSSLGKPQGDVGDGVELGQQAHSLGARSGEGALNRNSVEDDQADFGTGDSRDLDGRRAVWFGEERSHHETSHDGTSEEETLEKSVGELGALLDLELSTSIQKGEEEFEVEIYGTESGWLRENRGNGLVAMEHLLPRLVRGFRGQGLACRLDSEGFRSAHEEEMKLLAHRAADEVLEGGRERRLEPLSPADRRLVHMALVDNPDVRTESEGTGFMKRVRIMPV